MLWNNPFHGKSLNRTRLPSALPRGVRPSVRGGRPFRGRRTSTPRRATCTPRANHAAKGCSARSAQSISCVAAIPFLVVFLGLLVAGRMQALAAEYGSEPILRFQVWQMAVAVLVSLVSASQLPTVAKVIAVVATAGALAVSVVKARREHDVDDLHF